MEPAWGASWAWGLSLISLTVMVHAFGIVMLARALERVRASVTQHGRRLERSVTVMVALVGAVGLLLAILHGIEAAMWAGAFMWLGALGSERDAVLYSVDSITTRGASGLVLQPEWRLMGALEAADGMLLFGISTAFVFAVMQQIMTMIVGAREPQPRP